MNTVPRTPHPARPPSRRGVLRAGGGLALAAAAGAAVTGCAAQDDDGVDAEGRVHIEIWHGQADNARKALERLVADFERSHPHIRVGLGGGVVADAMLQKVTAALAAGSYPDIAFVFGSDVPSVSRSPQVVDLTDLVHTAGSGAAPWQSYWSPARAAVTVNGRVRAAPALIDSLAVICNKKLFREAGLPLPRAGWRWKDFVGAARKLTDPDRGRFGTGWPGVGDEDTVWRLWPLVWDLGGDVISADGRHVGFRDEGARALEVVAALARDRSVYIDTKPGAEQMYQVFQSGRMGMCVTGPWRLPDVRAAEVDYHVVPLPTFSGRPMTICGPDTWTLFDNGTARVQAAKAFVRWFMQPAQDVRWDVEAGSLPLSRRTEELPAWRRKEAGTEGLSVFTEALGAARVRPVHPAYPQISQAVGEAVVAVLLGRRSPAQALRACADQADATLLIPR